MAKLSFKNGQTSIILRVRILDSSSGAAKTGLAYTSSGLIISAIADNEATAITYAQASSNIETIATLGTFAAPSTNKCRFKEVDPTNFPGLYEIQIADARWSVSGARSLIVSWPAVSGLSVATGMAEVQLTAVDPQDAVHFGITSLPNAAAEASGGLFTRGTGPGQIAQDANGRIDVSLKAILTTALTETSNGYLAAAFKKFLDVVTPVFTAASVNQTIDASTINSKVGAITGSGDNTVLGFFKALLSKAASVPSDIGGTFDPTTDSTEAIADSTASALAAIDSTVDSIKLKTDLITVDGFTIISALGEGGILHIYPWRDYLIANGQPIDLPVPNMVTGDVVTLSMSRVDGDPVEVVGVKLNDLEARFELTHVKTGLLAASAPRLQTYEVLLVDSLGNRKEMLYGVMALHRVLKTGN